MKTGTPGFIPERLKEAREARGLTVVGLAELLPVSRQALHSYENGTNTPQPDTLKAIATVLRFPLPFFYRDFRDLPTGTVFFRALSETPRRPRDASIRKFVWFKRIIEYLDRYLVFPDLNLPFSDKRITPLKLSGEDIELLAAEARRHWGIGSGPVPDIINVLESNGVAVTRLALQDDRIDGFSEWGADGRPYIVLNSAKSNAPRSRFDVSHELGHLLLHKEVPKRDHSVRHYYQTHESQAHRFAGAFLLPAESFTRDFAIPDLDIFLGLKPKWKVSVKSMIYRCKTLKLMTDDVERRLWIDYNRNGWNKGEPEDELLTPESPRFVRRSMKLLVDEGVQTVEDIKDALPFDPSDLEELAGLQPGFLARSPNILQMPELREDRPRPSPGQFRLFELPGKSGS